MCIITIRCLARQAARLLAGQRVMSSCWLQPWSWALTQAFGKSATRQYSVHYSREELLPESSASRTNRPQRCLALGVYYEVRCTSPRSVWQHGKHQIRRGQSCQYLLCNKRVMLLGDLFGLQGSSGKTMRGDDGWSHREIQLDLKGHTAWPSRMAVWPSKCHPPPQRSTYLCSHRLPRYFPPECSAA